MSDQTTGTTRPDVKNATYVFRMTFGNTISSPGKQLQELVLEQDAEKRVTADKSVNKETYSITLRGVKVNKKIYQPNEIDAELDFMEVGNDGITLKVPSIQAVTDLLLKRQVTVDFLHEKGVPYRDMTVLYRAHYVTRPVEEALLKAKLPYHIYSGVPFFGRAEIKDALSYLRMILLQDDL